MSKRFREQEGIAYDRNGHEIHKGDTVIWTDPELGYDAEYEVYEEPTEEMVKMANDYGECEAFPHECMVVK